MSAQSEADKNKQYYETWIAQHNQFNSKEAQEKRWRMFEAIWSACGLKR